MEHIKLFNVYIYVQSNQIISELRCHRNLSTSSKTVPLCLKQVLVVRMSLIQISDTRTSFLTILRFLCVIFFIICHDFNPSVWFVTIFLWRFFAPVWHSLKIGLIHRLRKMLPTKVLSTLYLILIQPHIDYCISVWGACALQYINLIQRLQNRAARAITGIFDYNQSVSAIINSLNWVTVKSRYFYFLGIFVYKCLNHIAPSSLVERFNVMDDSRPYHTRAVSNKDLIIPHSHLSICKTSVSL